MSDQPPRPAHAYSPDADRAGPRVSAPPPDWVVYFIARFMLFLLRHMASFRQRNGVRMPEWWKRVPEYPPGSTQEMAASLRGAFGNVVSTMCWLDGIGPGHKDWPYLSRTILAFGGSRRSLQMLDGRKHPRSWWNRREILPGMFAGLPEEPAPPSLLERRLAADSLPQPPPAEPIGVEPACVQRAGSPAPVRRVLARAGTGPPTGPPAMRGVPAACGPPAGHACPICYA